MPNPRHTDIAIPAPLIEFHTEHRGEAGRAWIAGLSETATHYLQRWNLRLDGASGHGLVSLVLPVRTRDDTPAVLKLQPVDDETAGEGLALRTWDGDGAVGVLDDDPETGTLLLERLDATYPLGRLPDDIEATVVLAELLSRLVAHSAPAGLRRLDDIVADMLDRVPRALTALTESDDRRRLRTWAAAVGEVAAEPSGDALLHWDLHYDNVLAGTREPWLAIDPKPLAGDPGFELLPALHNRWDEIVAAGDAAAAVRRRFDIMVDAVACDRQRALSWTLGRLLQNALWDIEDGECRLEPVHVTIAGALLDR